MITTRDIEFRGTVIAAYASIGRTSDRVTPEELEGWVSWCRFGDEVPPTDPRTAERLFQIFAESGEGRAFAARPRVLKPHLEIRGSNFVDPNGNRVVLNGADAFTMFRQFRDGVDLTPFLRQFQRLGFGMLRVFFMGSQRQNEVFDLNPREPGYYGDVRPFVEYLNDSGFIVLATVFVDNQDVKAPSDHWSRMSSILWGTRTLLSGGNEWSKNDFDPLLLAPPDGVYWSRGSDIGDAPPVRPYGSFAEFHPRRDLPAALMDTVASPVFIREKNGLTAPLIIDEPPKMGTNGSAIEYADPQLCWKFARHYSTECAGAVFHNWFTQRGRLMDELTELCAESWTAGMRG